MSWIADGEELLKRLKRKPTRVVGILLAAALIVGAGAWINSYLSERGRQAAERNVIAEVERDPTNAIASLLAAEEAHKPPEKKPINIDQVTIATSNNANRLNVTLRNPGEEAAVITQVSVYGIRSGFLCAALADVEHTLYINKIYVEVSTINATYQVDKDKQFRYPLTGTLTGNTCAGELNLNMNTAVHLPSSSVSTLRIVVPRQALISRTEGGQKRLSGKSLLDLTRFHILSVKVMDSSGTGDSHTIDLPETSKPSKIEGK